MKQILCLLFLILFNYIQTGIGAKSEPDYYQYLEKYGYTPTLQSRLGSIVGKAQRNDGIKTFQRLYKLPQTGELDERTKKFMQRPRCGNPDILTVKSFGQPVDPEKLKGSPLSQSRLANSKVSQVEAQNVWTKKNLKWFIEAYPKQQKELTSQEHVRRIINQSFYDWQKVSGLKFEMAQKRDAADFKIKFISKDHDDGYPFDGQGATLAHAFYPKSGDIHFDDDEYFTDTYTNQNDQYTLRLVAAHEIGHALGLSHSYEEDSLMYPVYQQFDSNFNIFTDDKQRIQQVYGEPNTNINPVPTKVSLPTLKPTYTTAASSSGGLPPDNWCPVDFQAGCEGPDGELYLFKDKHVWKYRARTKQTWDLQPKLLGQTFPPITDAVITGCAKSLNGYTYLFRRSDMWKARHHWSADGPHRLRAKNYPQNFRAVLSHNSSIYLVENEFAYAFNEYNYNKLLIVHKLRTILDPPPTESIHIGFTYDKQHYVFTRNHIYIYDATYGSILSGYPKSISNGWFACDAASEFKKPTTRPYRTDGRNRDRHRHAHHDHHDYHDDHHGHHGHHERYDHYHKRPYHHSPHERSDRRWND